MDGSNSLEVLMLVGRFDVGGIQRQVMATASGLAERGHRVRVLAVYPTGRFAEELRSSGIEVQSLDRASRADIRSLLSGISVVRAYEPDVLYCYHVLPNLLGLLYRLFTKRAKLVWGLRATDLDRHGLVKRTQFRVSRRLARFPDAIIANSGAVRDFQVGAGYPPGAITVIPNGIDTERFGPDPEQRDAVRHELGLDDETFVIGVVAQMRGKKGHWQLLEALPPVLAEQPDVTVLIVGDGPQRESLELAARARGLDDKIRWLGFRSDMPGIYNALDLLCLPSTFGEGFPNVIGEALATGVPVVATDVGGAKEVVGPHGTVVPAADPTELARSIVWAIREGRSGYLTWPVSEAVSRIDAEFSTRTLVSKTERVLTDLAANGRGGGPLAPPLETGARDCVVYVASVDLTDGAGPAVNERESLLALRRLLGDDLFVIVGQPRADHRDLETIRPDRLLPWGERRRPWSFLAHQLAKARIIRGEVRRQRPSAVVTRLDALPLGLLMGTIGLPVPVVVKTASTSTIRLDPARHGRAVAMLHRLLVRALAGKVVAADTITEQRRPIVAAALGIPESRVAVIDNGVNAERFHPVDRVTARRRCQVEPEAVVFGYAGAQAWTRGGRHLVDAAKRLRAEFDRPRILVVGGGESIDRLREHARSLGHEDICVFPGLVPYEDVVWWMNCFDVAVSIETSVRAQREGHGQQKVRQYTAAGVPVVSAVGGNTYLAESDLGTLVDPDDPTAIEDALVRWGHLAGQERAAFRERAAAYARARLAVDVLNEARVEFWDGVGLPVRREWAQEEAS